MAVRALNINEQIDAELPHEQLEQRMEKLRQQAEQIRILPQKHAAEWADYVEAKIIARKKSQFVQLERLKKPKPAASQPAVPQAQVAFKPIDIQWPADRIRVGLVNWVPVNDDRAIIGTSDRLAWLDRDYRVQMFAGGGGRPPFTRVEFDGRYVWIEGTVGEVPDVWLIDPKTAQWKALPLADLLPPTTGGFTISPVAPGKAAAIGAFGGTNGSPARTWFAIINIGSDMKATAEVIHEATDREPEGIVAARQPLPNEAFDPDRSTTVHSIDAEGVAHTHVLVGWYRVLDVEKRKVYTLKPIFNTMNDDPAVYDGAIWHLKTPTPTIDNKPLQLIRRRPGAFNVEVVEKALPFDGKDFPILQLISIGDRFIIRRADQVFVYDIASRQLAELPLPADLPAAQLRWVDHHGKAMVIDQKAWEIYAVTIEMPRKLPETRESEKP